VTRESNKKGGKNDEKIVMLEKPKDDTKAKDIWKAEEIAVVPEALDVVSDTRIRPEYDVKYKQYVGVEDTFLQVNAMMVISYDSYRHVYRRTFVSFHPTRFGNCGNVNCYFLIILLLLI